MPVHATGYFGIPGATGKMVHAVDESGRPICGQVLHPHAHFQWCAHGLVYEMLECSRCKRKAERMLAWKQTGAFRFERHDGAVAIYDRKHWGPETDENSPHHRGWTAFGPGPEQTNYLGYHPRRWRVGKFSPVRIPIRFKTAESAMKALDKKFPWQKK